MSATHTDAIATCWSCGAAADAGHFCPKCGTIQRLPRGTDHFRFLGLPRKLWIEMGELEQKFHQLSWKLHPDHFVRATEEERELSLERSSQLNDAYRVLRDPVARVEYLLAIEGMRKEGATKQQAPPELLEEVFELNEWLDELRGARAAQQDGAETAGLRKRLEDAARGFEERLADVDAQLMAAAKEWDATVDSGDAAAGRVVLARMNEILNRRSYIRNLVRGVTQELSQ
ncbi:MAG TPA: Fe-S protein assembly co-chaperone HscB [Candidatus Acidoferrales bacterium]|nr:Fe-S protein assembly co-chaperone HscB [Candidatus Acidoferrales bacterium]